MAKFGGNEFTGFSVPLVFIDRHFLLEPTDPPLMSVFVLVNGKPEFEVLKNKAVGTSVSDAITTPPGIVTVSDKATQRFLYKVRPASETSVTFGKLDGEEVTAQITDKKIQVGGIKIQNNTFSGVMAGVVVDATGGVGIGARLPQAVVDLLRAS
jgi:hypothetical protein